MINTWTMRSVTLVLAGLALAVGGCRNQGPAMKEEPAKASPTVVSATVPVAVSSQPAAGVPAVKAVDEKVAPQPAAAPLTLAENGTTAYAIVTSAQPLLAEQTAAKELAEYLKKVTGAEFKTVAESATEPKPAKAIYLGWTAFAAAQGIDCAKLGVEESVIKTVGDSLVITGGRPRGTIYGVYDFLQKDLGVYWLDRDTEVVPRRPTLTLNAMDRRTGYAFRIRNLYTQFLEKQWSKTSWGPWGKETEEKERRFRVRNRQNQFGWGGSEMWPFGGGDYVGHVYHSCHNFNFYVPAEKHFVQHPEYYALDKEGKRLSTSDHLSGSICLTHPEVRQIALTNLLDVIAADRREFPPGKPASPHQQPPPTIYDISQPDNGVVCYCPACRELVRREGSESGPLIDFINELAAGVRERYPDVRLMTFAYWWGMTPPKTLRPADNVIIRWCDWYAPLLKSKFPEPWSPLTAPVNTERAENLRQWSAITRGGLYVWDYGEPYGWPGFPFTLAPMLADDLRLFAECHAIALFVESEEQMPWEMNWMPHDFTHRAGGQFSPLFNWLATQLMLDPRQPVEPLIATFMAGYYGAAAPAMRTLYDKLAAAQRALPTRKATKGDVLKIDYVTPAFFAEVDALLQQAEAACAPGSLTLLHVQRERLRSDSALLGNWDRLKQKLAPGAAMPFERETVITRIESRAKPVMTGLGYPETFVSNGGHYSTQPLSRHIADWRADTGQAPEAAPKTAPKKVVTGLPPVGPELSQAPVSGRYVRVERRNQYLCIAEMQVFSAGQNVALKKKATQSSLSEWGGPAELAVDGNTSGDWQDGSVTHTRNGPSEWWEVDLGQTFPIEKIIYYDRANHQPDWVPGTDVVVLDAKRQVVWRRTIETTLDDKGDKISFPAENLEGK